MSAAQPYAAEFGGSMTGGHHHRHTRRHHLALAVTRHRPELAVTRHPLLLPAHTALAPGPRPPDLASAASKGAVLAGAAGAVVVRTRKKDARAAAVRAALAARRAAVWGWQNKATVGLSTVWVSGVYAGTVHHHWGYLIGETLLICFLEAK